MTRPFGQYSVTKELLCVFLPNNEKGEDMRVLMVRGTAKIANFNEPFPGSHTSNEGKIPFDYIGPLGVPMHTPNFV